MSTISTISTLQKSLNSRTVIADQDRKLDQARKELVSGLKADVYADKSFRAAQTLDLRNRMARADAYATSNMLLEGKLKVTSDLTTAIRSEAQEFRALSLSFSSGSQGREVLQSQAQSVLKSLTAQLNTVYGGENLFSGADSGSESLRLPAGGLPVARLPQDAAVADVSTTIAALDSYFGLNGAVESVPSYNSEVYLGSTEPASARLDEATTTEYGMTAGDDAIRQLIKGLMMYAETDVDKLSDPAAYEAWISEANAALNAGVEGLQSQELALSNQQSFLAKTIERQTALQGIYNNRVVDIEGVDEFEVATRLEALTAQLEASYAVTVRLKNLSLLNYF